MAIHHPKIAKMQKCTQVWLVSSFRLIKVGLMQQLA